MAKMKIENLAKKLEVECIYEYICDSAVNGAWSQVDDLVDRARKCEGYSSNDFANVLEEYVSEGMRKSILNRIL
jgi:hypothetical protein